MNYLTLAAAKRYLNITATAEDTLLETFLQWATTQVEYFKNRYYEPRYETHLVDFPLSNRTPFGVFEGRLLPAVFQQPLRLADDLLSVTSLLNGDGEALTDYVLEPAVNWPKTRIRLVNGAVWSTPSNGQTEQVLSITGIWGSHDKYPYAWQASGKTVLDNPLSSSATTVTIAGISGFEAGQLIRMGSEFALVTAVNTVTSTPPTATTYNLTVERGANGSTAASHVKDTAISIWQVQGNIAQACARLVKWRYTQKDVDTFDKTYVAETGMVSVPAAIPADVIALLGPPKAAL